MLGLVEYVKFRVRQISPATWILAITGALLFITVYQQFSETRKRVEEAVNLSIGSLAEKIDAIPVDSITEQSATLSTAPSAIVLPYKASHFCQWLETVNDNLGTESPENWRGAPPSEYVVAGVPDDGKCNTETAAAPVERVYVIVKQHMGKSETRRHLVLNFTSAHDNWRFGVVTTIKADGRRRFHAYRSSLPASAGDVVGNDIKDISFFSYAHATSDGGDVSFFRLVLPISSAVASGDSLELSAAVYGTMRSGARFERQMPTLVKPRTRTFIRSEEQLQPNLSRMLAPCEGVAISLDEVRIPIVGECSVEKEKVRQWPDRWLSRALFENIPTRQRSFNKDGISFEVWLSGEVEVLQHLPEVRQQAAMAGLGVVLLIGAQWSASRSLRRRVRRLVEGMRFALETGNTAILPYKDDPDLGPLASAAGQAALSIARERALQAQLRQDQIVEQERARAFEDRAYVITHELRNFVSAVSINVKADPVIREKSWLAEQIIEHVSVIANRDAWNPDFRAEPVQATMVRIFDDWWNQKCDRTKAELRVAATFRADADVAITCVASLVHQILDKFLENALEHRQNAEAIDVAVELSEEFAGISLSNTHEDIDAERAAALFRPAPHARGEARVRGFGLLAAREYALAAGGFVNAISRYPKVAFCVYLPRADRTLSECSGGRPLQTSENDDTVSTA